MRTNSGNYNKDAVKWWYSSFEVLKISFLPNVLQRISFANLNHAEFNPSIFSDTKRQLAICHTSIDTLHVTWYPIALKQRQIQEWGKFFHYLSNMTIYWTLEMLIFPMYAHISRYGEILHLENEFYCDDGKGILQRGTFMNRKITTCFENEAF